MNGGYPPPPGWGYAYPPPPPLKNPWNKPLQRCANTVCFGLVASLILAYVVMPVLYTLGRYALDRAGYFGVAETPLFLLSLNLAVYLFVFLLPMFIVKAWVGIPTRIAFPLRAPRPGIAVPAVFVCLGSSVVGSMAAGVLVTLLEQIFGIAATMPELIKPDSAASWILYVLSLAVAPAIVEEMLFRGVILQSLRRFGDGFALVVSAILFSMAHGNLVQGPNTLVMGLVLGYFVLRSGSLLTGILIHFVNNLLAIGLDGLATRMPALQEVISVVMLGGYTLAGTIALLVLLATTRNLFRLAPSDYPVEPAKKYRLFFASPVSVVYIICTVILVITTLEF